MEDQLRPLLADLYYPSESDEPVTFVRCPLDQLDPLTVTQIKQWLLLPPAVFVEEIPEDQFWQPVTTVEDWYGAEEKARTDKFVQLRQQLTAQLTVRQTFRAGQSDVTLLLLGRQTDGTRAGLKTTVIET